MPTFSLSVRRVKEALQKLDKPIETYLWLQHELRHQNGAGGGPGSLDFRRRFNGFYRVRRNHAWRTAFFELLERANKRGIGFEGALRGLEKATGRIEASFASKLVASIDPDQPVIDSVVLRNLGLALPPRTAPNRLARICALHSDLRAQYRSYLRAPAGRRLVTQFKRRFPKAHISEIKMLDLVLWQTRSPRIALAHPRGGERSVAR